MIEAIQNIAKNCNAQVFKESNCDLPILIFEWRKIELEISKMYKRRFPNRPSPAGAFLTEMVFYSHNKHFEWLVAEALIGDNRKHCEFELPMMTTPYFPERLNSDFLWNGTEQPDYDKLGAAVKEMFETQGISGVSAKTNMRNKLCVVSSGWKTIGRINGVEYELQTQHTVKEATGSIITPVRSFQRGAERLLFTTSLRVRDKSQTDDGESIGPLACSLFATSEPQFFRDTKSNNWARGDVRKLSAETYSQDSTTTKPDIDFIRKVASNWKLHKNHETIKQLQGAIASKVKVQ